MNQNAIMTNDGSTHIGDYRSLVNDHSCCEFKMVNRAAHISALSIFLRNFPLEVFDQEERAWFLNIQSRVCCMESMAFDDLGME